MKVLEGKTLVIGAGKSGISSSALLIRQGYPCALYDGNKDLNLEEVRAKRQELKDLEILVGDLTEEEMSKFSNLVLSPGVAIDNPLVNAFRDRGAYILGEIELAYLFGKGRIVAITGTNGKTTTTTLVGEIMKRKYADVRVVGNIGFPYTDIADQTTDDTVIVAEISSFQLETVHKFHAVTAAILNVTPDHLNRHYTMECYNSCKQAVTINQTKDDVCILNAGNDYTRDFMDRCPSEVYSFISTDQKADTKAHARLVGDDILLNVDGKEENLMNIYDMNLVGTCNVENVMAAIEMGLSMGVPMDDIIDTVKNFKAVEHRIEYTATVDGVKYYNDSKGTNPDAAIQGIRAMNGPTCLIGGGYDKGSTYDEWIEAFDGKVKKLVLIGQTRQAIADCAKAHGFTDYVFAETLEEAIDICRENAQDGENVLLSPACASWGMFPNYEVRGEIFKDYVRNMK